MKKLIAVLTMLAVCVSSSAYAAVGDVAGKVVYTDISAYINHYPIPAYAYDGGMVVVAEDLQNYGFDVTYDDVSRSLAIVPNREKSIIGMGTVYKNGGRVNMRFADALYSDINVYFNETWINSCAINGYTMVKLEDLASDYAGTSFTWDNSTRSAKLWIDWAPITEYSQLTDTSCFANGSSYSAAYIKSILGEPESVSKERLQGADGMYVQNWNYPSKGMKFVMSRANKNKKQVSASLTISAPSVFTAYAGIGIGSTRNEVLSRCGNSINYEDSRITYNDDYVIGSIYGGTIIKFNHDTVCEIFIGAAAE